MTIEYTGQNIEVTQAIKDYADKKLERIKKHSTHITSVHVSFHIENKQQVAKGIVHIAGAEIFAHQSSDDLYKSIDLLSDKLITQLEKHKK